MEEFSRVEISLPDPKGRGLNQKLRTNINLDTNRKSFSETLICTFVYVNGLNPDIFLEKLNWARDDAAHTHQAYICMDG